MQLFPDSRYHLQLFRLPWSISVLLPLSEVEGVHLESNDYILSESVLSSWIWSPHWLSLLPEPQGGSRWTVINMRIQPCHAKGMEMAPFARLRLRVWPLDSVSSSPCSSDFLSAILARNRRVTESHSSGSRRSRNPRQMMQVAVRRTTLKITSCFKTSTARQEAKREPRSREGRKKGMKGVRERKTNQD